MKDLVIIGLLALIICFKLFDITSDIQLGIPQWHIAQEAMLLVLTVIGAMYLSYDLIRRSREVKALAKRLEHADKKIDNMSTQMRSARQEYSQAVSQQFETWGFTKSEQQVAFLLLKGLSFKEIAEVRQTKEKPSDNRHRPFTVKRQSMDAILFALGLWKILFKNIIKILLRMKRHQALRRLNQRRIGLAVIAICY